MQQQATEFGIGEARRVLGEVFAPWVLDLNLSIEGFDFTPPAGGAADWQPGAILRMPFSERLCRNGGVVSRPGADGVCRHRDGDRQPRRQPRLSCR